MTTETVDRTMPAGKWVFDAEVAGCFDNMLARSIPQYDVMRQTVYDLGAKFVKPNTWVVDLGCSRGEALAPFVDQFGSHNSFCACDISEPMLAESRARFKGWIDAKVIEVRNTDLRKAYPPVGPSSLTLAILTIQFTPIEHRQRILRDIYNHTAAGGALILVEKVLGSDAETDALLVNQYYQMKKSNGYTQEDIDRKRLSLEGVLVPVTAPWNEDLLHGAGFRTIECFWRYLNFAAWVAVK